MSDRDTNALLKEQAIEELLERVLGRLRSLARVVKGGYGVETDELVDGAVAKLFLRDNPPQLKDSAQFFAIAAYAMRQVLIDHRRKFRPMEALESNEAVAPPARQDQLAFDELTAFLVAQMQEKLEDDPVALQVLQRHLFGDEGEPVEISKVAQELQIPPHDAYRARKRGLKVLKDVLERQLDG